MAGEWHGLTLQKKSHFAPQNSWSRNVSYIWFNTNKQGLGISHVKYDITSKFHLAPRQWNHQCKQNKNKINQNKSTSRRACSNVSRNKNFLGVGGEQCFPGLRFATVVVSLPCLMKNESLPSIPLKWVCGREAESEAGTQNSDYSEYLRSTSVSLPASIQVVNINFNSTNILALCWQHRQSRDGESGSSVMTDNLKNCFKALGPCPGEMDASLPLEFTSPSQCRKAQKSQLNQKHMAQSLSGQGYWGKTKSLFWQPSNFFQWPTEMLTMR